MASGYQTPFAKLPKLDEGKREEGGETRQNRLLRREEKGRMRKEGGEKRVVREGERRKAILKY